MREGRRQSRRQRCSQIVRMSRRRHHPSRCNRALHVLRKFRQSRSAPTGYRKRRIQRQEQRLLRAVLHRRSAAPSRVLLTHPQLPRQPLRYAPLTAARSRPSAAMRRSQWQAECRMCGPVRAPTASDSCALWPQSAFLQSQSQTKKIRRRPSQQQPWHHTHLESALPLPVLPRADLPCQLHHAGGKSSPAPLRRLCWLGQGLRKRPRRRWRWLVDQKKPEARRRLRRSLRYVWPRMRVPCLQQSLRHYRRRRHGHMGI